MLTWTDSPKKMKINSKTIKISQAKSEIDKELELGDDVVMMVKGECVKIEDYNNQDDTFDRCYVIRAVLVELK